VLGIWRQGKELRECVAQIDVMNESLTCMILVVYVQASQLGHSFEGVTGRTWLDSLGTD